MMEDSLARKVRNTPIIGSVSGGLSVMMEDRTTTAYFVILLFILSLGLFGPYLAPYQFDEPMYGDSGELLRSASPSIDHPLGTTSTGYDVLSRVLYGARPTVLTGLIGGTLIIGIGLTIGITAGYMGGVVDSALMRFTDGVYSVPLLPFAIVLVGFFGVGFIESVVVIGLLLWRGNARVIRSQVLQIKQRPFVRAAKTTGASGPRIVFKHIFPNIATMAVLFFSLGVGYAIIIQASLAFLGISSPFVPSWGVMIRNVYNATLIDSAWWWSLPPMFLIALTVLSTFMFGRGYERVVGHGDDKAFVEGTG